jgi:hypothetical protein
LVILIEESYKFDLNVAFVYLIKQYETFFIAVPLEKISSKTVFGGNRRKINEK